MALALIVDDMSIVRTTLGRIVSTVGFEPVEAPDAASALQLYRHRLPDVVLLDLHLGPADGLDVLRSMRTLNDSAPVIVVSGEHGVVVVRDALEAGAVDFVVKPFMKERVIRALNRAVPGHFLGTPSSPHPRLRRVLEG